MNKIVVNSLAVNYADEGKGPVLLLLHGWGVNLGTFDDLAAQLGKSYRVVRLDLPGFGSSERPSAAWGVYDYAELVRDFLNKLNIKQLEAIIGHSFGGRIGIMGLGRNILAANKLVLVGSAGISSTGSPRNRLFKYLAKGGKLLLSLPFLATLRAHARKRLYEAAGSTDYLKAGLMKDTFLKTIAQDLRPYAKNVAVPTLMIWGEDDEVTPLSEAAQMRSAIPDARLEVIPGAKHFVYLDEPKRVEELILEFLQ